MKLKLTVDGKRYEVEVEVDEPQSPRPAYVPPHAHAQVQSSAPPAAPAPSGGQERVANEDKVCRSPIAGVVVRVTAQVGRQIAAGDVLMVLEAMKMETEITSPQAGAVKEIRVNPSDSVKSGQVLVEFE